MNKSVLSQVLLESYRGSSLAKGWSDALLDEYFITTHLPALLEESGESLSAAQVAQRWSEHVGLSEGLKSRWTTRITPAVADFLCILKSKLRARKTNPNLLPLNR